MTPPAVPSVAGDELTKMLDTLVDVAGEEGYDCNVYRANPRILSARAPIAALVALLRERAERAEAERDAARAEVEHAYREGGALYEAEIRAREEESRAEKAEAEVDRLRKRLSTRETARDVAMHRVYQAADEILAYLPVPGWEHSAEASAVYERLLRSVREVKRLVKRKRRMKERRAASAIVPGSQR